MTAVRAVSNAKPKGVKPKKRGLKKVLSSWQMYVFLLPAMLYFVIFRYVPMFGVQIAFKDYNATHDNQLNVVSLHL